MTISRLDLDGIGSPRGLAKRIHEIEDLPFAVPLEDLCAGLDINSIEEMSTTAFEGALITDQIRSSGHILVSQHSPRRRRRFSIAHELGHFLIEAHQLGSNGRIECSLADLHFLDPRDRNKRRRMEAEANTFAAQLLMPAKKIRQVIGQSGVSLETLVTMADQFDVSKEAMARTFVRSHREPTAIVISRSGLVQRFYRHEDFPYLPVAFGKPLPVESLALDPPPSGNATSVEEIDPDDWLGETEARRVLLLTEQVLGQQNGYALTLLQAELDEDD